MVAIELTTVTLEAPDPQALAHFYADLLGWRVTTDEPEWSVARGPAGTTALAFSKNANHIAPVWPEQDGAQQMQLHLEVRTDDLSAAVEHAVTCGARLADYQPQPDVRVCLDPAGHPFCLWLG